MSVSGTVPQFSADKQWWWTGSEWVPASQAPQPAEAPDLGNGTGDGNGTGEAAAADGDGQAKSGAVRSATSTGMKAVGWLADQAKKQNEQMKANREAAAARAAQERQLAAEQAAAWQVQYDAWFAELQRECPMPLVKARNLVPGGLQLMQDECLVSTAKHWGFSSDRLALTTHRLIWSHGRVTKDSQQLYLTDIREVAYHKPMLGTGSLTVEAASRHSLEGLVHMKHAQQFRDSLLLMVHYAKQRGQHVVVHMPAAVAASPPPAPTPSAPDKFEQLKKLAELKEQGILTDEEFQSEKAKLLAT